MLLIVGWACRKGSKRKGKIVGVSNKLKEWVKVINVLAMVCVTMLVMGMSVRCKL